MKKLVLVIFIATAAAAASGCSKGEARPDQVRKPSIAVEVAAAHPAEVVEGIDVTGSLEPKFWADVKTQIPGLVKQVYVHEWVRVSKGTMLARIDVAETEALVKRAEASVESARAGLAQARVTATRADREFARAVKLKDAGLATQQSVDDARTEAEAAAARIDASKAQIRVAEEEVRQARARQAKGLVVAPIDGVVALRDVNVGDLASDAAASKPIFRIIDNRVLNLTVTVPSAESARVKIGQPLEFTVDALPGKTFTGKVMFINPELNAADRSLKVVAEVRNVDELLKAGVFAKGRIITGRRGNALQVPRSAMAGWDSVSGKGRLFVVSGETARARGVETGTVSGDLVEVVKGLQAGERFVVRGGFNLKDGDRITIASRGN
ncbi:efflux RND transporter periplasmic adaptor subunit [Geobacter sp. DSM 9736]|uniref:efflux RND transporter periplasmic adaptor subunit n=1 Tax=Geobacter sp. DSM 9736 TaxID=1277350 RepID=UPI000B5138A4|nr:efflux RND transporter periplasmic adaptor subunit [Geobacter sp. DSM 9736]SNB46873.1 RND family efflux transporter, MFP subunit [Geobacter sp. DSM 9736]